VVSPPGRASGCFAGYTFRDSGLEIFEIQGNRLAVFVELNYYLITAALGRFGQFLLFALFHLLCFVSPFFLTSPFLGSLCESRS